MYKIISKVLANRLKVIIDLIILDTQNAFIPGRLIWDNIMVAYEVMHFSKIKNKCKQGWMALKLDMSTAYDLVEWGFLKAVLQKTGFDDKVTNLFISCISSVNYHINHDGRTFGQINPSCGLLREDPMSFYLFLVCIEGFKALI